jgi:signal transduction histidine kinase
MQGKDYNGVEVYAAYTYIEELKWGVIAKINKSEIVDPIKKSVIIVFLLYLIFITISSIALIKLSNPLLNKIIKSEQNLKTANENYEAVNEELRQTNEELLYSKSKAEEGEKLKTAFLQNMSHEIRTPMNAICGFSERLNKLDLSIEKREKYTDIIIKSSD